MFAVLKIHTMREDPENCGHRRKCENCKIARSSSRTGFVRLPCLSMARHIKRIVTRTNPTKLTEMVCQGMGAMDAHGAGDRQRLGFFPGYRFALSGQIRGLYCCCGEATHCGNKIILMLCQWIPIQ
jgi:hypothetical protein